MIQMKCSISIVQRYLKLFSNEKKHRSFSVIECSPAAKLIVIDKPWFSKLLCVRNTLIFLFYQTKGKENPIWSFCKTYFPESVLMPYFPELPLQTGERHVGELCTKNYL